MNPALIITIIETAIKLAPGLVNDLRTLFAKGDPTAEDWDKLRATVSKTYDDYVNEAKGTTPPPVAG